MVFFLLWISSNCKRELSETEWSEKSSGEQKINTLFHIWMSYAIRNNMRFTLTLLTKVEFYLNMTHSKWYAFETWTELCESIEWKQTRNITFFSYSLSISMYLIHMLYKQFEQCILITSVILVIIIITRLFCSSRYNNTHVFCSNKHIQSY